MLMAIFRSLSLVSSTEELEAVMIILLRGPPGHLPAAYSKIGARKSKESE